MKMRLVASGIKSYFPRIAVLKKASKEVTIEKASSRYCYSIWLRTLSILNEHGLNTAPNTVAELGPGDSIGVGLAAILTGSRKYYALDVVEHTDLHQNIGLLKELISLLSDRTDIPDDGEFPRVYPRLESYRFPSTILTEVRIQEGLREERIGVLRESLLDCSKMNKELSPISYCCPWYDPNVVAKESVDMVYSQAVLEHVEDLQHTYEAMRFWLKDGGVMSHQVDFKSHGTSDSWNGHWTYSDFRWKLMRGRKTYLINREPLSTHIDLLNKAGFQVISILPVKKPSEIQRRKLARRFQEISEEDLSTSSAHILSMKK